MWNDDDKARDRETMKNQDSSATSVVEPDGDCVADVERILIVDDDAGIRREISGYLSERGYAVETADGGPAMLSVLERTGVDLVILDLMLPGEDGLAVCRKLVAAGGPPVIMLSAFGDDTDRIVGLELGADDFVSKPCNPRELAARVRAILRRRAEGGQTQSLRDRLITFEGWTLDLVLRQVRNPRGVSVPLSSGEFALLRVFIERPHRVLSREQLLDLVQGPESEVFDRSVDVQISRLRRKLGKDSAGRDIIQTIRNEGYAFAARAIKCHRAV
jgi:two-component system OmpR family response regulator